MFLCCFIYCQKNKNKQLTLPDDFPMNVIIDNYDEIQNDNEDIIFEWKKSLRDMKSMKTNETWI